MRQSLAVGQQLPFYNRFLKPHHVTEMPGQLFAPGHINISVTNWAPTGFLLFGDERVEPFFYIHFNRNLCSSCPALFNRFSKVFYSLIVLCTVKRVREILKMF